MARDAVAEVRERTDIVELIESYVALKKTGRSYKGLCPFHQEKTPSFIVFPDSQNFHCFGCGRGGDAFSFYMGVEHAEFRDALQELARRAGVELASVPTVAPEVDAHRQRLIEINELAAAFYANILTNSQAGAPGRAVVEQRGLSREVIERFGLGYALDRWDALHSYLAARGVDPVVAAEAGLLQTRQNGGHYDRFRGRLMFPIRTREGRVVGFGGRIVGEGQPKYLNSPQSAIFDKSTLVYGLDLAKDESRKRDQVVIVEGYMDAIAAHQFGHANVVAAMGTAVTEAQIGLVKRLSKRIVLALDAESIPIPDANRIVRFERKLNAEIAIVRLPEGKDPDELIRKDPERWPEVVAAAQPFLDFYLDAVTVGVAPGDAGAKAEAVHRAAPILQQIGDRVVQSHYIGVLANRLQTPYASVLSEVRREALRTSTTPVADHRRLPGAVARVSHEDHLLALFLKHRGVCADILPLVPEEDLGDSRNRELLRILRDERLADLEPEQIVAGLDDAVADHAERLLASIAGTPAQVPGNIQREARQALELLGKERFLFLMRQLQAAIQSAEQTADAASLGDLRSQLATVAERHQRFYPPPSPYFRDSRDTRTAT